MKVKELTGVDLDAAGIQTESHGIRLTGHNLRFVMDAVIRYSYPEASCVREWTTNAVDAHIEARMVGGMSDAALRASGHPDPDAIRTYFENYDPPNIRVELSADQFSVRDYGVGISKLRLTSLFTEMFESTKRLTNDQHGAKGIGRFVGLGVSESFSVESNYLGTKIVAVLRLDKAGVPMLDIVSESPTDEPNGTKMSVIITKPNEFFSALVSQLAYFTDLDIVIEDSAKEELSWMNKNRQDSLTDSIVYRGKKFAVRTNSPFDRLHAVMGSVTYPLDQRMIEGYDGGTTNVALVFEIGEMEVTWNREQVQYTDEFKKLLGKRYLEALSEIDTLFKERNPRPKNLEQLIPYYKASKENSIEIWDDVKVNLSQSMRRVVGIGAYLPSRYTKLFNVKDIAPDVPHGNSFFEVYGHVENGQSKRAAKGRWDKPRIDFYDVVRGATNGRKLVYLDGVERMSAYMAPFAESELGKGRIDLIMPSKLETIMDSMLDSLRLYGTDKVNAHEFLRKMATRMQQDAIALMKKHADLVLTPDSVPEEFIKQVRLERRAIRSGNTKAATVATTVFPVLRSSNTWSWWKSEIDIANVHKGNSFFLYMTRADSDRDADKALDLMRSSIEIIKVSKDFAKAVSGNPRFVYIGDVLANRERWERKLDYAGKMMWLLNALSSIESEPAEIMGISQKLKAFRSHAKLACAGYERKLKQTVPLYTDPDPMVKSALEIIDTVKHKYPLVSAVQMDAALASKKVLREEISFYVSRKPQASGKYFRMLAEKRTREQEAEIAKLTSEAEATA